MLARKVIAVNGMSGPAAVATEDVAATEGLWDISITRMWFTFR